MSGDIIELDALLSQEEQPYDWLIPGLIERGDRLILTGQEGRGKSTLLRQFAVQVASGIHPFGGESFDPLRVLYVDLENSRRQVRRKVTDLRTAAGDDYDPDAGSVTFMFRPEGLDLTRDQDREHIWRTLADCAPVDLLIIGPIYKMLGGDPVKEEPTLVVATMIDALREDHGCAVMLEAHSPYADGSKSKRPIRPYGASLWSRWPEFGIYLAPDGDIEHWRGPRDERAWPARLRRGEPWPWMPDTTAAPVEQWDGPTAAMAAVREVLTATGEEMTTNRLLTAVRIAGHTFRDRTVREAAERLATMGEAIVRNGPRNARIYVAKSVEGDASGLF